jgi:rhamnose utilization protein RhaD (predicted bifunctional aldolase and dehydrogenase)
MDKTLADLIRISNKVGKDSALVQGGGGNTSAKTADGKYMYIKVSGTALRDMSRQAGWRRVRLDGVLSIIRDRQIARLHTCAREREVINRLLLACDDDVKTGGRPSVETHLHAMLDKYVVHLHPLVIGAYVNSRKGREQFEKLFQNEKFPPLWVPYADPGFMLAKKIARLVAGYRKQYGRNPAVMVMAKHGLFVTAATADAALRRVRKVIRVCSSKLREPKARIRKRPDWEAVIKAKLAIRRAIFDATGQYLPVHYVPTTGPVAAFMARRDAPRLLATTAINQAELVYANGPAMWLGLFIAADKKTSAVVAEVTVASLLVRTYAARFGGVLALTKRQQDFINDWESEVLRKELTSIPSADKIVEAVKAIV